MAATLACAAVAADRHPIDRNLLLQQQQSDSFSLRTRQAADELRARSLDARDQATLRDLHRDQRRRQDALHAQQLQRLDQGRVAHDTPAERRAAQSRMAQERAAQMEQFNTENALDPAAGRWGPTLD